MNVAKKTCANCGREFIPTNSDEDALEEARGFYAEGSLEAQGIEAGEYEVICHDCWLEMTEQDD